MPRPQLYINVHQTMLISVISIALLAYVFDFKGFRTSINETYMKANNHQFALDVDVKDSNWR